MKKNKINNTKKNHNSKSNTIYEGQIDINKSGIGFVSIKDFERDVVIYPENLYSALQGDIIKIKIVNINSNKNKKNEGEVVSIVKRKQNEFIGTLDLKSTFGFVIPSNNQIPFDIFISLNNINNAIDGDLVMVKITEWRKQKNPVGEVIKVLTQQSENEQAMLEIIAENSFSTQFPDEVLEAAARMHNHISENEIISREDFRKILTFTIDPKDAKDFDDAISIKSLRQDCFEIGVHIADVSHYVPIDSTIDLEAYQRATSVYLPDRVLPMLPEILSNELCSLRPNEDKLCVSAIFEIHKNGKITNFRFANTIINSNRRYAYEEVQNIIEGTHDDYEEEIHILNSITQTLRSERFKKGAINFSSSEVRFVLDENAVPISVELKESKAAHQLIEELMLLANKYIATTCNQIKIQSNTLPFPYRIHDVPNEEKLYTFAQFVARFGYEISLNTPESIAASFNEMLLKSKGKPEEHIIANIGIRTMSKATYSTDNIGHYGLGFKYYCHFTSPIRRYPDIIVHRLIKSIILKDIKIIKKLEEKCTHCSVQERNAIEAERTAIKYKQVEYMQKFIGDTIEGVVSGVSSFGIFIETTEAKCEGLIPIVDLLEIDQFEFSEKDYALVGRNTKLKFTIGDALKVQVVSANLSKRQINFSLSSMNTPKIKKSKKES